VTEQNRQSIYDALHLEDELRFPVEDYPDFFDWLNVPEDARGMRLLDIACGQGFFLAAAERANTTLELHGVDFSTVALNFARTKLSRTELHQDSVYAMPFEEETFDYIVNLGSLEHFDQPERALSELHRVLKPTGKAMIIVPNQYYVGSIWKALAYGEPEDQGQDGVTTFRTINQWRRLFLTSQLDVLGVDGYNGVDHIAWYFRRKNGVITDQERSWRLILDVFVKPWIPLNLAQCFVFYLRRQPTRPT